MLPSSCHPEPQPRACPEQSEGDRSECHEPIRRIGAALLEVMVALTILATAGLAAISLTREAIKAVEHARSADRELAKASAFLEAVALWPREDLDRRLGERAQGSWWLRIDRPHPMIYELVLSDATRSREILRTALYRPEPADASR